METNLTDKKPGLFPVGIGVIYKARWFSYKRIPNFFAHLAYFLSYIYFYTNKEKDIPNISLHQLNL